MARKKLRVRTHRCREIIPALAAILAVSLLPGIPSRAEEGNASHQVESYRVDLSWLSLSGQVTEDPFADPASERGVSLPPPLPPKDGSAESIRKFLAESHQHVQALFSAAEIPVPPGTLVAFDPATQTLAVRHAVNSPLRELLRSQEQIHREHCFKWIAMDHSVFEGPAPMIRDLLRDSFSQANHGPALRKLEDHVAAGEARHLSSLHLQVRSGQRARAGQTSEVHVPSAFLRLPNGDVRTEFETISTGHQLEVDPVLSAHGHIIDLNLAPVFHDAPAQHTWSTLYRFPDGTDLSGLVTRSTSAELMTLLTIRAGHPRILMVWNSPRLTRAGEKDPPNRPDQLRISFLIPDTVVLLPSEHEHLRTWVERHGESVVPLPPEASHQGAEKPSPPEPTPTHEPNGEDLFTETYSVPLLFHAADASSAPDDPFAAPTPKSRLRSAKAAKNILEEIGIPFPEGASAVYNPSTSQLIVRNTRENLELVEAYTATLGPDPPSFLSFRLDIIEAPADRLRTVSKELRPLADHSEAWERLEKQAGADGPARLLATTFLQARSGQLAQVEFGESYPFFLPAQEARKRKTGKASEEDETLESGAFRLERNQRRVGTTFEIDPILGPDGFTIDVNVSLEYHRAAPDHPAKVPQPQFHPANVVTSLTLQSGTTRMIGIWKPDQDTGDFLQAAFLQAQVVSIETEEIIP